MLQMVEHSRNDDDDDDSDGGKAASFKLNLFACFCSEKCQVTNSIKTWVVKNFKA